MAPDDLIKIHREVGTEGRQIKAFYHSHPNEGAYFSAKDKADATQPWGIPNFPDTAYVVISLYDRQINAARAYSWDDSAEDFVEVPINEADDM